MPQTLITISESAARQINKIMAKQNRSDYLRVSVDGGGCSGFQYKFDFADKPQADDEIIERDGARVLIDSVSAKFLSGSEIDYADEIIGSAFKIRNPNAKSSCGCGTSFSV